MLYKVYDKDWTFKKQISGNQIISDITFSSQINWWQGSCTINTSLLFSDTGIIHWDIIKIYRELQDIEINYWNDSWTWSDTDTREDTTGEWTYLLYSWYVAQIERKFTATSSLISYKLVGLASVMKELIYNNWTTREFTLTGEPKDLIEAIIDFINVEYNYFDYTDTIDTYWTDISIDIDDDTCFDILDDIADITGWKRNVDQLGQVRFWDSDIYTNHLLTAQEDVSSIEIDEDGYAIKNNNYLTIKTWTSEENDATSETKYWLREIVQSKTDITDKTTKDEYITNYFEENAVPIEKITIVVNNKYDKDKIKPWDTVKIRNIDYDMVGLQINKVSWSIDNITLSIQKIDNYTQLIKS